MNRDELEEKYPEMELLTADGFDDAILGVDHISHRVVYSYNTMVEILMEDDNMSQEDAIEFLEYNVVNAYVGEKTPIFVI